MKIDFENLNIALEAMETKILKSPRLPKFNGVEEVKWDDVDKTFDGMKKAYFKRTSAKKPEEDYKSFAECPEAMREWMSEHSILGNPKGKTFREGVMLPCVNPATGKLNKNAVVLANIYTGKIKDISESLKKETKEFLGELYLKYFERDGKGEMDIDKECLTISEDRMTDIIARFEQDELEK